MITDVEKEYFAKLSVKVTPSYETSKFKPRTCNNKSPAHCKKCTMHNVCSIYLEWEGKQ